jgi:hypothetical protein
MLLFTAATGGFGEAAEADGRAAGAGDGGVVATLIVEAGTASSGSATAAAAASGVELESAGRSRALRAASTEAKPKITPAAPATNTVHPAPLRRERGPTLTGGTL